MSRNNRSQLMQITLQLHPFLLIQKNVNTSEQAASKQRDFSPSHFYLPTLRLISMLSHVYLAPPPVSLALHLCTYVSLLLYMYLSIPSCISSIYLYLSLSIPSCISSIYLYLSQSIPTCISSIYIYCFLVHTSFHLYTYLPTNLFLSPSLSSLSL